MELPPSHLDFDHLFTPGARLRSSKGVCIEPVLSTGHRATLPSGGFTIADPLDPFGGKTITGPAGEFPIEVASVDGKPVAVRVVLSLNPVVRWEPLASFYGSTRYAAVLDVTSRHLLSQHLDQKGSDAFVKTLKRLDAQPVLAATLAGAPVVAFESGDGGITCFAGHDAGGSIAVLVSNAIATNALFEPIEAPPRFEIPPGESTVRLTQRGTEAGEWGLHRAGDRVELAGTLDGLGRFAATAQPVDDEGRPAFTRESRDGIGAFFESAWWGVPAEARLQIAIPQASRPFSPDSAPG